MESSLQLNDVSVFYSKVRAVEGVSMSADEGEVVCIIGANGAGKTTTLRAVTGLTRPAAGEIRFEGSRLDGLSASRIAAMGISMVPEGRRVFPLMTVRDNLLMGAFLRKDKRAVRDDLQQVCQRLPRLSERMGQLAGTLSGGEQQMLAIGRALMARPRLLLLDEPSHGLAPLMIREIARAILAINRLDRVTVLLVEQNSRMALTISRRAYVLEAGRVALAGPSQELAGDSRVKRLYLGG